MKKHKPIYNLSLNKNQSTLILVKTQDILQKHRNFKRNLGTNYISFDIKLSTVFFTMIGTKWKSYA